MRILFLQGGFDSGGAEKNVALFAAHRLACGDEVAVAAMFMPPEGSFFPYPEKVRLHALERDPRLRSWQLHWRRLRWIKRLIFYEKPDLIISFLIKINVLTAIAASQSGTPFILSERNNSLRQASLIWRAAHRYLLRRARRVVMQTKRAQAQLPASVLARSVVIPNPCPAIDFIPEPGPPQGCRISAVGRLDPQKGFDLLISAFARFAHENPAVTLTIYGEGAERRALTERCDHLGLSDQLRLPGRSAGPGDWLRQTDLLVVSSRYEGYMNVISEASVSGIPVIAFDCDFGPAEQILPDVNGILVPPEDVTALAEAMRDLVTHPGRRRALTRGAAHFRDILDPAVILAQWDRVIHEAVTAA